MSRRISPCPISRNKFECIPSYLSNFPFKRSWEKRKRERKEKFPHISRCKRTATAMWERRCRCRTRCTAAPSTHRDRFEVNETWANRSLSTITWLGLIRGGQPTEIAEKVLKTSFWPFAAYSIRRTRQDRGAVSNRPALLLRCSTQKLVARLSPLSRALQYYKRTRNSGHVSAREDVLLVFLLLLLPPETKL